MEFKTTLEIVTKDIQDIEKLVSNFKNYSRIPNIELDLALSRLRNVYDLLLLFRSDNPILTDVAEFEGALKEIKKQSTEKAVVKEAVPEVIAPVAETPKEVVHPVVEKEEDPAPKSAAAEKAAAKKQEHEEKKFINEKLGEKITKKDISSKLQGQAIKSIAGSLGINDKFFFIRELFAGNSENFRLTMSELDELHNFNEAYSLLIERFQWDMDSEPVQLLLNLIRRKYIPAGNE
jgi:hypothetical protein